MEEDIRDARWVACDGYRLPLSNKMPHKFRDRLNEWIRGLAQIGRAKEGDAFRTEALRLADVRNNVAHNIHGMWIDLTDELRVFTSFPNKKYDQQFQAWTANPIGPAPSPLLAVTYGGRELADAYGQIQACMRYALEVRAQVRASRPA